MGRPKYSKDLRKRKTRKEWTSDEKLYLKKHYCNTTNKNLSKILNKSENSIIMMGRDLGLVKTSFLKIVEFDRLDELDYSGVYALINKSNRKVCIGSSHNIKSRIKLHISDLNHNRHYNTELLNDWNEKNFCVGLLYKCDKNDVEFYEQKFIRCWPNETYNKNIQHEIIPDTPKLRNRIYSKIKKTSNCWVWTGRLDSKGYGSFKYNKKAYLVHRVLYYWEIKKDPNGFTIHHKCGNRLCCNPRHLECKTAHNNQVERWKDLLDKEMLILWDNKKDVLSYKCNKESIKILSEKYNVRKNSILFFMHNANKWEKQGRPPSEYEAFNEKKTIVDWSRDSRCVVSYEILKKRLYKGWDVEKAITKKSFSKQRGCKQSTYYEVFGEKKSIRQWAKDSRCVISYQVLRTRLKEKWNIKDAILTPPLYENINYVAFGESKSISAWSEDKRCVVCKQTLRSRINKGWDIEKAITKENKRVYYTAFGETKCVKQWAKDDRCLVSYSTLKLRLFEGWDIESALLTPIKSDDIKLYLAFGEEKTMLEWSKDKRCLVNYSVLRNRIVSGWDIEKAITSKTNHPKKHFGFGEEKTLMEWFEDKRCQIPYNTLKKRLQSGKTVEEAFSAKYEGPNKTYQ